MFDVPESGIRARCRPWMELMGSLVAYQWKLFGVQCEAGLNVMETALGAAGERGEPALPAAGEFERLEGQALERVRRGLAPPAEIYAAPYRRRVDWSKFPDWARPSDPEMFEGAHEG
jgi:hypothetical protein